MEKLYKRIFYLIMTGALFFTLSVHAQKESYVIRGTITDNKDKQPVPGVSVAELDKDGRIISGSITDMNGNYVLKISNSNDKLSFSFIGYKTSVVEISNRKVIDFPLESNAVELNTVEIVSQSKVSNGFMGMNDKEVTGAVQTINMKDLEGVSATSIDEALEGRIAGMDVVANSGDPGAGMSIRIRGTSSISGSNQPLIVIDNIPYDTEVDKDFDFAAADDEQYAQMLNIPTENIKEISIIKDAALTSVWGSKAANGVLMITTKRGFKGKPKIQYSLKTSRTYQPDPISLLNGDQYSMMIREAYQNPDGVPMPSSIKPFQYDPTWDSYYEYSQNTNWVKAITQTGLKNQHNLAVSGGGEKARYRMSLNYSNTSGTTIGTNAKNITSSINLDYMVSNKLSFSTDLSYSHGDVDNLYVTSDKPEVREVAYTKMPNEGIYEFDANGHQGPNYFTPYNTDGTLNPQGNWPNTYNPVAMARNAISNTINDRVIPKFDLRYDISKVFRYTLDIAFDINNGKTKKSLPGSASGLPWTDINYNRSSDNESMSFLVQTFNKLLYTPNLGEKHRLSLLLSVITTDKSSTSYSSVTTNSASSELQDPISTNRTSGSDNTLGVNNGQSENRNLAGLVLANYVLLDRYIFAASIRREGDSKFGSNYQYGNFPSISGRWRLSEEPFMKKKFTFLDDLSVRASYGVNGNAPDQNYLQYSNYTTFSYMIFNEKGIYPQNMELDNLRWEKTIQRDLGFNLIMFKDRVNVDVDFYLKRTKDQISKDRAVPAITGFSKMTMNIGTSDNQGWEISIFTNMVRKKDYSVDFNFNFSRNRNIIRSRPASDLLPKGTITKNGEYLTRLQLDNPIGSFYGYKYLGVYKDKASTIAKDVNGNPLYDINNRPLYMQFNYPSSNYTFQAGDAIYEDINHDGNINNLDVIYLGNASPLWEGGFGPTFRYKGLSLSAFFQYRVGNDIINKNRMNLESMYDYDNQSTATLRRWRHEGDVTDIPRALYNDGYNWLGSSRFVEDGSFLRLKTVTLSYGLPKTFVQKIKFSDFKIFVTGTNLWTYTKYLGQDPEIGISDDPAKTGIDNSRTPVSREIMLGVNIGF